MEAWVAILIAVFLLLAAFFILRNRTKSAEKKEEAIRPVASLTPKEQLDKFIHSDKHWGVAIETRDGAHMCKAVRKICDQPFIKYEAPKLPLEECDNMNCRCRYFGLPDQRKAERRVNTTDRREQIRYEPDKKNRRSGEERRKLEELWSDKNTRDI